MTATPLAPATPPQNRSPQSALGPYAPLPRALTLLATDRALHRLRLALLPLLPSTTPRLHAPTLLPHAPAYGPRGRPRPQPTWPRPPQRRRRFRGQRRPPRLRRPSSHARRRPRRPLSRPRRPSSGEGLPAASTAPPSTSASLAARHTPPPSAASTTTASPAPAAARAPAASVAPLSTSASPAALNTPPPSAASTTTASLAPTAAKAPATRKVLFSASAPLVAPRTPPPSAAPPTMASSAPASAPPTRPAPTSAALPAAAYSSASASPPTASPAAAIIHLLLHLRLVRTYYPTTCPPTTSSASRSSEDRTAPTQGAARLDGATRRRTQHASRSEQRCSWARSPARSEGPPHLLRHHSQPHLYHLRLSRHRRRPLLRLASRDSRRWPTRMGTPVEEEPCAVRLVGWFGSKARPPASTVLHQDRPAGGDRLLSSSSTSWTTISSSATTSSATSSSAGISPGHQHIHRLKDHSKVPYCTICGPGPARREPPRPHPDRRTPSPPRALHVARPRLPPALRAERPRLPAQPRHHRPGRDALRPSASSLPAAPRQTAAHHAPHRHQRLAPSASSSAPATPAATTRPSLKQDIIAGNEVQDPRPSSPRGGSAHVPSQGEGRRRQRCRGPAGSASPRPPPPTCASARHPQGRRARPARPGHRRRRLRRPHGAALQHPAARARHRPGVPGHLRQQLVDTIKRNLPISDSSIAPTLSNAEPMRIELTKDVTISITRHLPLDRARVVDGIAQDYYRLGATQLSTSAFNAPVVLAKKPDGSWRFCVDYRELNAVTKRDAYQFPRMSDMFESLAGSKYFSTIDLAAGFHQIPIHPKDRHYTAFSTLSGHWEFTRVPYGLTNSPPWMQRAISQRSARPRVEHLRGLDRRHHHPLQDRRAAHRGPQRRHAAPCRSAASPSAYASATSA